MRKWFLIFLFAVCAGPAFSQDQFVSTGGSTYVDIVRGAAWGTISFNRVFWFTPLTPDQRFCLFVANNNPTNSHTFSLSVYQTGDRQVSNYSGNTGRWIQDTVQGTPSPVAAASMTSAYVHANAGAFIALAFSGGATQAGSPDTADVFLVQTTGESCGPVQGGQINVNAGSVQTTDIDGGSNTIRVPGDPNGNVIQSLAYGHVWNRTNWDRAQGSAAQGALVQGPLQPAITKNSETTSAANTALTVSISAVATQRIYLSALAARDSAGSCSLTVKDGVGGTVIWSTDGSFISTTLRTVDWPVPLASTSGNGMDIVVSACGAGNTSTLDVQASQL